MLAVRRAGRIGQNALMSPVGRPIGLVSRDAGGEDGGVPQSGIGSGGFVGRSAALAALRGALDAAVSGRGSTVLVAGEAGIGKTRVVAELTDLAGNAGAVVLYGRCIELVGPGVPYFALLEALRSASHSGRPSWLVDGPDPAGLPPADVQRRLFEELRGTLDTMAATAPLVLVVEDLHWADRSTLDAVSFLSRAIRDRRILLVATYRDDEVRPGDPLARLAVELVRAREAVAVHLPPLHPDELRRLLEAAAGRALPGDLTEAIIARSGGNPFFAEELLAAAERGEQALPGLLRDALLQRVAKVEPAGQAVLRVAAAFAGDVPYRLLAALIPAAEPELDVALRQAVEHGVLVPDRAAAAYRFRHALLAEAVYGTILPGEAERLHERLARALAEDPGLGGDRPAAGELARHWNAAGHPVEALAASVRAAREAEAVSGLVEALRHLEWALELWPEAPAADELTGMDLATALAWAAELADLTGRGPRAAELARRAIDLTDADGVRAGLLYERLGSYLLPIGDRNAALAACRRAAELVPARPPSAQRARVLTSLGNALMLSWRHADSLPVCEEALATAAAIGDPRPALRAHNILGIDLCYLGRPEQARRHLLAARQRALECGTPRDIAHSHAALCEVLIATGPPWEAAEVAQDGLALARRLGVEHSFGALLAAYAAEACLETGDWDRADDLLSEAHRTGTAFWAHYPRLLHAHLAIARGDNAAARQHLAAGAQGERQPTSAARYAWVVAELALWERRPDAAASSVQAGLAGSDAGRSPVHRARLAALGLRAQADCAQLAAARRDQPAIEAARTRARELLALARDTVAGTPEAVAWRALAEAEYARSEEHPDPDPWRDAVAAWETLERPYPTAYCRWRLVEAMLAAGAASSPGEPVRIAREAHRVASGLEAAPLQRELELLAQRGRLDLTGLPPPGHPDPIDSLGLTARESQVLRLLTRGHTNREIAIELTISIKTASVHVSHILHKLGVFRRIDAAAIAHRLDPPQTEAPDHSTRPGR
jgi:DNA-binding CsgD family transcriptional regulator/tetratricopeptide (TPR) repeat protein